MSISSAATTIPTISGSVGALYLRPRLIELQYHRIRRYRELLRDKLEFTLTDADVFIDLRLPKFAMGQVILNEVPAFDRLLQGVKANKFQVVLIDLDNTRQRLTPDFESGFVREALEASGAKVFDVFTDDGAAFDCALKEKFGSLAREEDVTDASDFVCFFPSLASEVLSVALRRELEHPAGVMSDFRKVKQRLEALRTLRPYSGGGRPFVEDRLSFGWREAE